MKKANLRAAFSSALEGLSVMDLAAFESPKLLIEATKVSLSEFEAQAAIFAQTCRHVVSRRLDADTGETIVSLSLQDKLHNSARINASRIVKGIYFPMGRDPSDFERELSIKCKNAHSDLVSFIRRLTPYLGGNSELWALGRMAGPNKHQRILGVGIESDPITFTGHATRPGTMQGISYGQVWHGSRNELEVIRVSPSGHFDAQLAPTFQVTIGEAEVFEGQPAAATFHKLIGIAESIVLGLEAETARIKALTP